MTARRFDAKDEGGFVMPVAIFVLVLLLLIAAIGMYSARNDFRAAAATRDAAVALAAADAGVARTVATWDASVPTMPAPGDSTVVDWQPLPDGSLFRIVVVRPPVGPDDPITNRVIVYSTGRTRGAVAARRTVMTMVDVAPSGLICCEAGFKVTSRLRVDGDIRNDPIPEVSGLDRPPPGWPASRCTAPLTDLPGVTSSDAGDVETRRNGDIEGSPQVLEDPTITVADFTNFGGTTYLDLVTAADAAFTGNQRFTDEIAPVVSAGSCDTSVPTNWGSPLDPTGPCGDYSPIVHIGGNLQLRGVGEGQGILVVDGDLRIEDDFVFYGIIVVLGRAQLRDNTRIYGALLVRGGDDGGDRSEMEGEAKVLYSSCTVEQAQGGLPSGDTQIVPGRSWFEVIG